MLNRIDEFTHQCPAIRVYRTLKAIDVIDVLFILRGMPRQMPLDKGPEFVAKSIQNWITAVGARTKYSAPSSSCESSLIKIANCRLRSELLNGKLFYTPTEAQGVSEA